MKTTPIITLITSLSILTGCNLSSETFYIRVNEKIIESNDLLSGFNEDDIVYRHYRIGYLMEQENNLNDLVRKDDDDVIYKVFPVRGFEFDIGNCFVSRETSSGTVLDYFPTRNKTRPPSTNDTLSCIIPGK